MLYNAPEQCILIKCTVQRTGNKVRKCGKWWLFSPPNLRTQESIGKQRKNRINAVLFILAGPSVQFTNRRNQRFVAVWERN